VQVIRGAARQLGHRRGGQRGHGADATGPRRSGRGAISTAGPGRPLTILFRYGSAPTHRRWAEGS
jgi:hypothetical protein